MPPDETGDGPTTDKVDYAAEFLGELSPRVVVAGERLGQIRSVLVGSDGDGRRRVLELTCESLGELEGILADARRVIRQLASGRRP